MLIFENILLALAALKANKVRSFLTMLGIMIGISSVIAVMTVGDSMSRSMRSSMDGLGANKVEFYVSVKSQGMDGMEEEEDTDSPIRDMKDTDYVTEEMIENTGRRFQTQIKSISLKKEVGSGTVQLGKQKFQYQIIGQNTGAVQEKNLEILVGSTLSEKEQENGNRVVLVADKAARKMWGDDLNEALGKKLEVNIDDKYYSYTVVGVYQYNQSDYGIQTGSGRTINTEAYIPLNTAFKDSHSLGLYDSFTINAVSNEAAVQMSTIVTEYLNDRYYQNNDTYGIEGYNMASMQKEMNNMMQTIKLAIAGIAGISLLVGGIGVMNIMIVSITERTREIGTRKALGATNASIRIQFVMEAIVICVIGGLIGVIIGIGLGMGITKMMGYQGTPSLLVILGTVAFSAVFGITFGYYPANKAAKMNPIEALRYE